MFPMKMNYKYRYIIDLVPYMLYYVNEMNRALDHLCAHIG